MTLRSVFTGQRYPFAHLYEDPLSKIQRVVVRSFEDIMGGLPATRPIEAASISLRVDVKEDEAAYHVTADLPGLSEKEVEVTFDDSVLTIRGEKKVEREENKDTWHLIERSSGTFARQLVLPTPIDQARIEAKFEKGVLYVTLPKQEKAKAASHKIEVKAA